MFSEVGTKLPLFCEDITIFRKSLSFLSRIVAATCFLFHFLYLGLYSGRKEQEMLCGTVAKRAF